MLGDDEGARKKPSNECQLNVYLLGCCCSEHTKPIHIYSHNGMPIISSRARGLWNDTQSNIYSFSFNFAWFTYSLNNYQFWYTLKCIKHTLSIYVFDLQIDYSSEKKLVSSLFVFCVAKLISVLPHVERTAKQNTLKIWHDIITTAAMAYKKHDVMCHI